MFVTTRDRMHVSLLGHAIEFKKGVPQFVPPALHKEVSEFADPVDPLPEEDEAVKLPAGPPEDSEKREADVLAAMDMIATRNAREDFTAAGAPHLKALAGLLGWAPDAKERDLMWIRFQAGDAD